MDYQHYTFKELIEDERFRAWVFAPDETSSRFWESWLREYPDKQREVEAARAFLQMRAQNRATLSKAQIDQTLANINRARFETPVVPMRPAGRFAAVRWVAAAAVVLLMSVFAYVYFFNQYATFSTGNGEQLALSLPDGSQVILNANSELRYPHRWEGQRDVYLEGEAYFAVQKLHADTGMVKLVVHTADLDVEVLGTRFNVATRQQQTQVMLEEGKVRIAADGQQVYMQPGELVEYTGPAQLVKREANPRLYTAWKDQELILENRTMQEVATILEETYGLSIHIPDTSVANLRLYGSVNMDNADAILQALALSYQLDIVRDQDEVSIRKKTE
ncbi:ferric-dicitrate binding protein FerR, regulates iron transport through sigma-19 [Catalinimonas alkaloidigena]|uniref:Ferric-dicitrate binding protein FerR, regulates iron transport through sigma-19 n=1 Tax=Catalinimonas alkaloidigena TaxID=1075417 RepID=A0A1G9A4I8_9BACT|nr:FecR domain-containing protein [Catalinimonas alkaloidigena]SDK22253.1 ferric-dicitrate binding protein FerR, regulates iron transport through sigma-19 [Catalinimonas alkaloidigena]